MHNSGIEIILNFIIFFLILITNKVLPDIQISKNQTIKIYQNIQ